MASGHNFARGKRDGKPIKWVGSAKRDLDAMPEDVKDVFGHAIDLAQAGGKHPDAKVMTGFGSAGVLEVVEDDRVDTYRAVYTVKFSGWVYVLHCFQKKSKSGIKTPKEDMDLIHTRLKAAKQDFEAWQRKQGAR
jgi:phage-related protein